jgi:diamine N-acetyltransferase
VDPSFRVAVDSDVELLLRMMRLYYAHDGHAYDEPRARTALLHFLRNPSFGRAWLIYDQDTPVGYIVLVFGYSLEFLGRDAFVDEFFLLESHRGRGWGRRTLEFLEDEARAAGVRAIHLEVVQANTTAREVYRRAGYADREHHLMSKWIERGFAKPGTGTP